MSRSCRLVHAPVPSPFLRFAALVTGSASDGDVTAALADWNQVQLFHSLPGDWPADDQTLGEQPPAPGYWFTRGQGVYSGIDPNLIVTPRPVAGGRMLIFKALWLYDASAAPLPNQCPSPVCPPCPTCPGGVTPPTSSSSGVGAAAVLFVAGIAAGAATAYAARRKK